MLVPHEVPLGPRVFVNRVPDFARMDEFWQRRDGSARVGVCSGLPGVGKTAFVRRCVQRVRDEGAFPGGDLYVDFGPVGEVRLSVADALASCLSSLGVAREALPPSAAARSGLLRSITADRPVLIVLEDATEAAQVEPFLPNSQASAVVVTSSGRLSELVVDGAKLIRLAPLDGEDGAQMLRELVGERAETETDAVADLVGLCAGLPVALKVAAACLIGRPALSIAELADRIAADERGLGAFPVSGQKTVAGVFSAAYDGLDADAAWLYRLMGIVPGQDLALDTAEALTDLPAAVVRRAQEALDDAGLLINGVADRLSLHPMVRRHAAHLAERVDSEADRTAALRRVVDHLLVPAAFADLAILGPGRYRVTPETVTAGRTSPFTGADPKGVALRWLNTERSNLLAVQGAAARHGWHEESWQLAEAMTALYVTQRYLVDWTVSSEIGASSAHQVGNVRAEARLRSFVSRAWTDLGDLDRAAQELLDRALPLAEDSSDVRLRASVWELVGRLRDATGADGAQEAYDRAIELFTSREDNRGVAFVTFFLGCSQHQHGDLDRAQATLRRALPQIRAVPDTRMEGRCRTELGSVLRHAGRLAEARREVSNAVTMLQDSGDLFYEAQAHEVAVEIASAEGDRTAERAALNRLVEIHQALGSDRESEFTTRLDRL
jgi:tetratricopeptide (TPR) repeat protein